MSDLFGNHIVVSHEVAHMLKKKKNNGLAHLHEILYVEATIRSAHKQMPS